MAFYWQANFKRNLGNLIHRSKITKPFFFNKYDKNTHTNGYWVDSCVYDNEECEMTLIQIIDVLIFV